MAAMDADVTTARSDYEGMASVWKQMRDVIEGSRAVKGASETYLPRLTNQTDSEYEAYKMRALFYGATARTVQGLTGVVFQKDTSTEEPDSVKPHLQDITLAAEPLESIAMRTVKQILSVGRGGILMDYAAPTEIDPQGRPYWVPYRAEQIINWDELTRLGDRTLSFVVLEETVDERQGFGINKVKQYRVCELVADPEGQTDPRTKGPLYVYRLQVWREVEKARVKGGDEHQPDKEWQAGGFDEGGVWRQGLANYPVRLEKRLTFIPFVCFNATAIGMALEKPPLEDLADVNVSHYRSSADLEHGRHWTALPTIVVTGSNPTQFAVGGQAMCLPEPQADAKMLEYAGTGLVSLEKALEQKERQMSILGARLLEGQDPKGEAAQTVMMRHAGDAASLTTISKTVSIGLTLLWRWHCWWFGATQDVDDDKIVVTLNSDFFAMEMTTAEVKEATLAMQSGGVSYATYYEWLRRGRRTRDGVSAEEELEAIRDEQAEQAEADTAIEVDKAERMAEAVPPPPTAGGFGA